MADEKPVPAKREYTMGEIDASIVRAPAMALWFDQAIFDRARLMAKYLAEAEGFVPPHLLNKPMACFAVVSRSLAWKLDPYAVANATYQTPGGRVGFEGKLCQAAIENSGHIEGGVQYEHYGDWDKIKGMFEIAQNPKSGKDFPKPTWTRAQAKEWKLGVVVSAKVRGEAERRQWQLDLAQCFPLNSTLWATDPKRQICYTAVRAFANLAVPGLFMGVEFDREGEETESIRAARATDVTPPRREDFTVSAAGTGGGAPGSGGSDPKSPPTNGASSGEEDRTGSPENSSSGDLPGTVEEHEEAEAAAAKTAAEIKAKNVTEGGKTFAIIGVPDGEVLFETEDPAEFSKLLLSEAMRLALNKPLLDALWENNSPQFKFMPTPEAAMAIRDGWPKIAKGKKEQGGLAV